MKRCSISSASFFLYNRVMNSSKYIFLDVDGTLYSPKLGEIPESALEALDLARKEGHKIFLCTGRSLAEVSRYLNEDVDGFILGAGAMIYADGKRIYDHPIPSADVTRIKKMIRKHNLGYCLEGGAGAYCDEKGYESLLWYFSGGETDRDIRIQKAMANGTYPEKFGSEEDDSIYKICAYGTQWAPDYVALGEDLESPYILTNVCEMKDEHFCIGEITNKEIDKSTGVGHVLEHYNAETFQAYGFGDSANDLPMMNVCGHSVAMGNGTDEIKAVADYVTTDILEHGIWNAFVHYGLIKGEKR